jgi:hypothetical protein
VQVVLYAAGGDKTAQEIERYADAFSVAPVHEPRDGKTVGRVARREGEIIALVGALAAHAELEWCDGDLGKDQGAQEGKSGLGQVWAPVISPAPHSASKAGKLMLLSPYISVRFDACFRSGAPSNSPLRSSSQVWARPVSPRPAVAMPIFL